QDIDIISFAFYVRILHIWTPVVKWQKPGSPLVRTVGGNTWLRGGQAGRQSGHHPCAKPLGDCREMIRRHTLPGTLVLGPFCGVGTIPLACQREGRIWFGIERSASYAQRARQRLNEAMAALTDHAVLSASRRSHL